MPSISRRAPGTKWKLIDDTDLRFVHPPRRESIGARSDPYGPARVNVYDMKGALAATSGTETTNFCWMTNLEPETQYRYEVIVKDEVWGDGERWDSTPGERQGLVQRGGVYVNTFRTHPDPALDPTGPFTFIVLGDYGTGIKRSTPRRRQREIDYFVSGAGSKVRKGAPDKFDGAHTVSWSDYAHFLLVTIDGDTMSVRAIGEIEDGALRDLRRLTPAGEALHGPIMLRR